MRRLSYIAVITLGMFVLHACGGADAPSDEAKDKTAETAEAVVELDPKEQMFARGEKIYADKCVVCHQANGEGIIHAFPPLKDADYFLEDPIRAVEQVLNGSHEEMVVNGITYNAPMPPQVDNHEDAVAVINYALNSWGNDGGWVTLEEVEHIEIGPRW